MCIEYTSFTGQWDSVHLGKPPLIDELCFLVFSRILWDGNPARNLILVPAQDLLETFLASSRPRLKNIPKILRIE